MSDSDDGDFQCRLIIHIVDSPITKVGGKLLGFGDDAGKLTTIFGSGTSKTVTSAELTEKALQQTVREGGEQLFNKEVGGATDTLTSSRGVFFVGDDLLPVLDRSNATLGRPGGTVFFTPLEDAATIRTVGDAARASGMAPSITKAYVAGGEGFGLSFPTKGLPIRIPTAVDAGGFAHFLEGGRTAVRTAGSKGGFLRNLNREFVTPGGGPVPSGSVLFKIGPNGEQIPIRRF